MPKEKSSRLNEVNEVVEAISILKDAESAWPAGVSNRLVNEVLQRTIRELQEKLFNIMNKKKKRILK